MHKKLRAIAPLIVVALLFISNVLRAQFQINTDYFKVELGYTASFLLADNPATHSIFSVGTEQNPGTLVTGSNFIGAQSSISARMNMELGERRKFIVPIGADVTFYRGLQRLEGDGVSGHGVVSANIYSIVAGLQYRFLDLPLAEAFLYGGLEMRGNFINAPNFKYEIVSRTGGSPPVIVHDTAIKSNVFRFGSAARVGVQGIVAEPVRVNISLAYGIMNLFGRDLRYLDPNTGKPNPIRRAELLTPSRIGETTESLVHFMHFSILLQYKL